MTPPESQVENIKMPKYLIFTKVKYFGAAEI